MLVSVYDMLMGFLRERGWDVNLVKSSNSVLPVDHSWLEVFVKGDEVLKDDVWVSVESSIGHDSDCVIVVWYRSKAGLRLCEVARRQMVDLREPGSLDELGRGISEYFEEFRRTRDWKRTSVWGSALSSRNRD